MDCNKPTIYFVPQTGPVNEESPSGGAGMFTCQNDDGYTVIDHTSKVEFLGQKTEPTEGLPTEGLGSEGDSSDSESFNARSVKNVKVELSAPTVSETVVAEGIDAVKTYVSEKSSTDLNLSELISAIKGTSTGSKRIEFLKEVFNAKSVDQWKGYVNELELHANGLIEVIEAGSGKNSNDQAVQTLKKYSDNISSLGYCIKLGAAEKLTSVTEVVDSINSLKTKISGYID